MNLKSSLYSQNNTNNDVIKVRSLIFGLENIILNKRKNTPNC